jgi:hypothetical protein
MTLKVICHLTQILNGLWKLNNQTFFWFAVYLIAWISLPITLFRGPLGRYHQLRIPKNLREPVDVASCMQRSFTPRRPNPLTSGNLFLIGGPGGRVGEVHCPSSGEHVVHVLQVTLPGLGCRRWPCQSTTSSRTGSGRAICCGWRWTTRTSARWGQSIARKESGNALEVIPGGLRPQPLGLWRQRGLPRRPSQPESRSSQFIPCKHISLFEGGRITHCSGQLQCCFLRISGFILGKSCCFFIFKIALLCQSGRSIFCTIFQT